MVSGENFPNAVSSYLFICMCAVGIDAHVEIGFEGMFGREN